MKKIVIRPIEEKDKGNYLKLFNSEDFGCVGINSDLKPSIYEEERIVSGVISGSIISTAILIIEDAGEFIGYTTMSRPTRNNYHIGQFVIREDKQGQGYGKALMDEVKAYAASDDCSISLECISNGCVFFKKQGFHNSSLTNYTYPRRKSLISKKKSPFVDYDLIEQERTKKVEDDIKSFQKFLNSPLFNEIMKL